VNVVKHSFTVNVLAVSVTTSALGAASSPVIVPVTLLVCWRPKQVTSHWEFDEQLPALPTVHVPLVHTPAVVTIVVSPPQNCASNLHAYSPPPVGGVPVPGVSDAGSTPAPADPESVP